MRLKTLATAELWYDLLDCLDEALDSDLHKLVDQYS